MAKQEDILVGSLLNVPGFEDEGPYMMIVTDNDEDGIAGLVSTDDGDSVYAFLTPGEMADAVIMATNTIDMIYSIMFEDEEAVQDEP